jgi:hypothetical protein
LNREDVEKLAVEAGIRYRHMSDEFYTEQSDGVALEQMQAFAHLVQSEFMDKLIAHPALARQIVDAHNLASDPAGLKKREAK